MLFEKGEGTYLYNRTFNFIPQNLEKFIPNLLPFDKSDPL
jgi:hypothetical protein